MLAAQSPPDPAKVQPTVERLTLDEAKRRVRGQQQAAGPRCHEHRGQGYATKALRPHYFPQVIGNSVYFRFNDDLGTVLATQGER